MDAPLAAPPRDAETAPTRRTRRLRRALVAAAVAAVLGGVFAAYLSPELRVQLAQQLWACF
ncbi:hypothetical protein [Piscinibacter sakaiensis]|uniref:Uncharacterized protein n=1 Tax=Piscinibacter sakaiensis TaxID=1547922 RepID=A0A0K8P4F5_PISS1|nr:hypothetical protein [Piscinibacter sakaiensis]GAP37548.1 hypothetical protein ISF6_3493 [Piscinibacter sakaiensis]